MAQFPPSLNSDIGHCETPASWGFGPFHGTVRRLNGFSYLMTGFRKQVRKAVLPHPVRERQAVTEVHLRQLFVRVSVREPGRDCPLWAQG